MLYKFGGKQPSVGRGTYVSILAAVIGDVVIGDHCYIGHGAILRGDYGRIEIGHGTAIEEGVIVHAPPKGPEPDRDEGNHRTWCGSPWEIYRQ